MDKKLKNSKSNNSKSNNKGFLFGKHACFAAMNNENRKILQILVSEKMLKELPPNINKQLITILSHDEISRIIGKESVHQGIIIKVEPLPELDISEIDLTKNIIILDQVTDPQNIGAIIRNAAAFNFSAVIMPKDNSPDINNASLAKAASGTREIVPLIRVTNLVRTIEWLKKQDYWCIGMDSTADKTIKQIINYEKIALIMGAEGKGLRDLTYKNCDLVAKLSMSENAESLNVSCAAAIAMYLIFAR